MIAPRQTNRNARPALIAPALAVMLLFAGAARAEEAVRQVLPGGQAPAAPQQMTREKAPDESEIQRFCSNIADAARDRRYALQAQELTELQAGIDQRMKALEDKRAEYEQWLKRREVFLARAEDGVVKIYAGMKPDAAAERLAMVNVDLAAAFWSISLRMTPALRESSFIRMAAARSTLTIARRSAAASGFMPA